MPKSKKYLLKNIATNEVWICDDYSQTKEIEGTTFIEVHKENQKRKFWIRRDSLAKIKLQPH